MIRCPTISTRTAPLLPTQTLFRWRSGRVALRRRNAMRPFRAPPIPGVPGCAGAPRHAPLRDGGAGGAFCDLRRFAPFRSGLGTSDKSEEHTSELQSLMRNSYAVFCLKKKTIIYHIFNMISHI